VTGTLKNYSTNLRFTTLNFDASYIHAPGALRSAETISERFLNTAQRDTVFAYRRM
jgi:hypothetical protein